MPKYSVPLLFLFDADNHQIAKGVTEQLMHVIDEHMKKMPISLNAEIRSNIVPLTS